ncbi:MAG: hypothetical protein ACC628_04965 [Pirellulaceae bacterium]
MSRTQTVAEMPFVDRRSYSPDRVSPPRERRQFTNSHRDLSPPARELAIAIDEYKLHHRRRFITYEEMLSIITDLGYYKDA